MAPPAWGATGRHGGALLKVLEHYRLCLLEANAAGFGCHVVSMELLCDFIGWLIGLSVWRYREGANYGMDGDGPSTEEVYMG